MSIYTRPRAPPQDTIRVTLFEMSFLKRSPRMPKLGEALKLQNIEQINGLPTFQNDPDGPNCAAEAKRWRGHTLEIIVYKQEALNRMKTLADLPQATDILLQSSSLGDSRLYLRMYFEFEKWNEIKAMMIGAGFRYRTMRRNNLPLTGHIGEFFIDDQALSTQ